MNKRVIIVLTLCLLSFVLNAFAQEDLDQYGGYTRLPSPNPSTGFFRLEKFGNQWLIVDPDNNAFFGTGVAVITAQAEPNEMGSNYRIIATAKYGDTGLNWGTAQLKRMKAWGFTMLGTSPANVIWPVSKSSRWPGNYPDPKMPFIPHVRMSLYAMKNEAGYISEPVKNFGFGINQTYDHAWIPPAGEADYFDQKLYTYFSGQLGDIPGKPAYYEMTEINDPTNPNRQWMLAIQTDEPDQTFSFNSGNDFPTLPQPGTNHAHGGYRAAITSPIQTGGICCNTRFIYTDTKVYNRLAWQDYIKSLPRYQTDGVPDITKLNAAWGSNYTTFDSSGTVVSEEIIGTGDGSTLTFSKTLSGPRVSKLSLQVLVDGIPVAGDFCGAPATQNWQFCKDTVAIGNLWGPNVTGTIDYTTGALALNFTAGNAPSVGSSITVSYVQNGWGIGTGLLDEDGRHTSWMGAIGGNSVTMAGTNPNLLIDLDDFLYQMAKKYFQEGKSRTLAHFNNLVPGWNPIYIGPASLFYRSTPSRIPVLKAAGEFLDVFGTDLLPQDRLDFVYRYAGDKPLFGGWFNSANADSAMWRYPDSSMAANTYPTQAARGQGYNDRLIGTVANPGMIKVVYPNGSHPYVSITLWKFVDHKAEQANWGLVSPSDNAYDGHEAVYTDASYSRTIPCSPPLQNYMCGGEERNYGDFITPVTQTNNLIYPTLAAQIGSNTSVLYGDVSENGVVSAYDASLAAQYAVGLITLTQEQITKADVSGNASVSAYDASLIAQYAVGLITKFPVQGA